jgi:hypothetical protein
MIVCEDANGCEIAGLWLFSRLQMMVLLWMREFKGVCSTTGFLN